MKKTLLSLFSVFALSFASLADQCITTASASGNDDGTTIATITNFSCAGGNPISAASLNGSGINTPGWSDFEIWVNGVYVSTQGANFTNLDLSAYLPLTSVELKLVDDPTDGFTDTWNITASLTLTYSPACPQPTGFTVQIATSNSATFTFTPGGSESSWSIEYGPVGFTLGQGTMTTVTSNPATITGLTSNTFYNFVIRSICGPGDTSTYTSPLTINTFNLGQYMDWNSSCSPFGFTDISSTGTNLNLDDDIGVNVSVPFPFVYQNNLVSNFWVNNNGKILFGSTSGAWTNTTMNTAPNGLYPLWDDYYGSLVSPTAVLTQTIGTSPNRLFITQWNVLSYDSGANGYISFQVVIEEATQNIYYIYDDVNAESPSGSDNGIAATIGFAGPTTDVTISHNNSTYLSNNTCVKIYNTDCPKPKNFVVTSVTSDEIQIDWSSGAANETEWTIIYGPTGFDPLTDGSTLSGLTSSDATIPGLTDLTTYDIYIYSNCSLTLTSLGYMNTVQTLPLCSIPTALSGSAMVDSIKVNWSFTATPGYDATSFNIQYGPTGFNLYSGNVISADVIPNDTIINSSLISGMIYQVYVQAVCGADTSTYAGPFTVTMPLQNDTVCGAEMLQVDGTIYTFNNTGATVTTGEASIEPPLTDYSQNDGWGSTGIYNSTWFKFIAPASGSVRINMTNTNVIQNKAAVYSVIDCGDFVTPNFTLVSANDNGWDGGPNFTACGLTPGDEYYILNSNTFSWSSEGIYSIKLTPIVLEAGVPTSIINACLKDTINLFTTISGQQAGGTWSWITPTAGLTDSLFNTNGSASQIFDFEYRVTDGCAYDAVIGQVKVYPPSSAGNDGTVSVCRNQPVDLLAGLTGNVDHGGTWINPSNQPIASSAIVSSNIPGQFNYSYITGNGVCPNDTALVLVNVLANCNYLSLEEMVFENITVYPNPTNGILHIANSNGSETFDVTITDANGRVVYSANAIVNGTKVTEINIEGKETGIYFVKVSNTSVQKMYRIVLQ